MSRAPLVLVHYDKAELKRMKRADLEDLLVKTKERLNAANLKLAMARIRLDEEEEKFQKLAKHKK